MFIALYEFSVKPEMTEQFEKNWHIVTESIYKVRGSLGSRLHKASDGTYVAYAQWPSEEQFNKDIPLPAEAMAARDLMRESCFKISTIKSMTVCDDLLKR